jgi:carotenoid cleavage dioxygenase
LHQWRFNLRTGEAKEERLDDRTLEFGVINSQYGGIKNRYGYSAKPMPGWFLFTGLTKHDLQTGRSWSLDMGQARTCSEAAFAPRIGAVDEDDGYLVTFVTDMAADTSECVVVDAKDIEAGPVCRIMLPHRISAGTHATWASGADILSVKST